MKIEEVLLNNTLTIGEECYYDHGKYIYQGINDDGKHVLLKKKIDGEETKYIANAPCLPSLPLGLYFKHKRTGSLAELVDYRHMLGKMHYEIKQYDNVFKDYSLETLDELRVDWELLSENPYKNEDELIEEIEVINSEIREHEKKIDKIKEINIDPLDKKLKELYKQCKHDWYKYDEVEVSKGRFEQECTCNKCGEEKVSRYSRF